MCTTSNKQTRTHIPKEVTRVINAATGEVKSMLKPPHEMSKAEINLEIAKLIHPKLNFFIDMRNRGDAAVNAMNGIITLCNYTNDIADIFPIMIELKIGIDYFPEGLSTMATLEPDKVFHVVNKNPLRSICECVLLVLRSKNDGGN